MQHAVDVHRLHRRALQRGQQHAPQRIAERHAEAALERLGDQRRRALRDRRRAHTCSLFGLISSCQFFWITFAPVALSGAVVRASHSAPWEISAAADEQSVGRM